MKKILSLILAAASAFMMGTAVFAESSSEERPAAATLTFDTDEALKYIHTFGNAADTNLTYELFDAEAISGRCLKLEENFTSDISNQYGGIYFDAADFGLDSFTGYTMTVSLKLDSSVAKATDILLIFSDGEQWISQNLITEGNTGKWISGSVSVPVTNNNTKLGISIPITTAYNGRVCLVDNVVITDNYGNAIANIGDIDTSLAQAPNTVTSVLTTILFILVIIAVILGVGFVVLRIIRRYR